MLRAMTVVVHAETQDECRAEADKIAEAAFGQADFDCRGSEQIPAKVEALPNPLHGNEGEPPMVKATTLWQGGYLYALREIE